MNRTRYPWLVAAALTGARVLSAAEPPSTPPPAPMPPHNYVNIQDTRSRTGYTLDAMRFESDVFYSRLEFSSLEGFAFNKADDVKGGHNVDASQDILFAQASFGITDWLTATTFLPFIQHVNFDPGDSNTGIGDLGLGARASLTGRRSPIGILKDLDAAVGFQITFPTGDEDKGLGRGDVTFQPYLSASHWFEGWIGLHGFVFMQWQSGERPIGGFNILSELVPFGRELSLMAALEMVQWGSSATAFSFIPGVQYRLYSPHVALGAGVPIGLTDKAQDWGIIINAKILF
jgi:hypothetical protein